MIQVVASTSQGETSHIISFINRVGLGDDILSQEFLKTTTCVDVQVSVAAAVAAQDQSAVGVHIEDAKARCDVVFTIWFYPPLEIEDHFKSFL